MISHIFYQTDVPLHLRKTTIFKKALEKGLKNFSKEDIEVNVVFVDEKEIFRINKQFLGHNYITDVISFNHPKPPLVEGTWPFGDIYVCFPVARRNAKKFKHTYLQEMMMYVVHGGLHLSGMDDHDPLDRAEMDKQAEKIIENILSK